MSTREERQREIDARVFHTITGDDWRRSIAASRRTPNAVRAQIIQKILALKLGKSPSDGDGKKE